MLNITFGNKKLEKTVNDYKSLQRVYGPVNAKLINQRLNDLRSATTLEDCRYLPGNYHNLVENRKYHIGVSVKHPMRIVFRPTNVPLPINSSGVLEWDKVNSVEITEIGDYHGK